MKMRIGGGQEFVIGGYTPSSEKLRCAVGWLLRARQAYVCSARAQRFCSGIASASVFRKFKGLESRKCPFANLPESEKGSWGEGLTEDDMKKCIWLKPQLVAAIEYAEWTPANHLRHSRFIALRDDKDPRKVRRE